MEGGLSCSFLLSELAQLAFQLCNLGKLGVRCGCLLIDNRGRCDLGVGESWLERSWVDGTETENNTVNYVLLM